MTTTDNDDAIRWDVVARLAEANRDPWARRIPDLNPTRREALLAHYAARPITEYAQYDLDHMPGGDGLAVADHNGDIAYQCTTAELWTGHFPVRIHIRRGTAATDAVRLLRKALAWIEAGHEFTFGEESDPWPTAADRGVRTCSYHDPDDQEDSHANLDDLVRTPPDPAPRRDVRARRLHLVRSES